MSGSEEPISGVVTPVEDYDQELTFQDFNESAGEVEIEGRIDGGKAAGAGDTGAAGEFTNDGPGDLSTFGGYRFWAVDYYRPYFNVTTTDVLARMASALWPFRKSFFKQTKKNPDLYGPFWICTTLVFVMAATSNLYGYLKFAGVISSSSSSSGSLVQQSETWQYDFSKIPFGAGLVYSYCFLFPLCLGVVFRIFQMGLGILQVICIYGYAMTLFVPTAALCVIPSEIVGWLLVLIAFLSSAVFLSLNFWHMIRKNVPKRGLLILSGMVFLHFVIACTFKLYFFEYDVESAFDRFKSKK